MERPPISYKLNRFLFYVTAVVAAVTFLLLSVNVFHFSVPMGNRENVGLLLTFVSSLLVNLSQFLEWRRKAKPG